MPAVRAAAIDHAAAIARIWAECLPYVVHTVRVVARRLSDHDPTRQMLVAVEGDKVIGCGELSCPSGEGSRGDVAVLVCPDARRRGAGSALLAELESLAIAADRTELHAFANLDGHSEEFAATRGYATRHVGRFSGCDPRAVSVPLPPASGFLVVALNELTDLQQLWRTHTAASPDDPGGGGRTMDYDEWHREFWSYPDHEPALGAAVLDARTVAAYTMTAGDPSRGHAWTNMTDTHPEYRGRGLATLAKATALRTMAAHGFRSAATGNDTENAPMLAVNARLGYTEIARAASMTKRL